MKHIIIAIIFLLVSVICAIIFRKKETFDKSNESYTIIARGGLCNYLRVILGVTSSTDKKIYVYLPKRFKDFNKCFEPIENVIFIPNKPTVYDYRGFDNFQDIRKKFNLDTTDEIIKKEYKKLILKPEIKKIVNDFVNKYNLREGISIHVRRTDHVSIAKLNNRYTPDEDFFKFIEKFPSTTKVFLATDNKESYELFKNKYPDQIVSYNTQFNTNKFRQTDMIDSVIDIFIAASTKYFKGSGWSSFSEQICYLSSGITEM